MNKPIFGLTLFFIGGIILGRYLFLPPVHLYLVLLALLGLAVFFYLRGLRKILTPLLFSFIFLLGALYFIVSYYPSAHNLVNLAPSQHPVELTGRIVNQPRLRPGKNLRVTFVLEAEKIFDQQESLPGLSEVDDVFSQTYSVKGRVWVTSFYPYKYYDYGDRVTLKTKLRIPSGAQEKGEFDWRRYLSYQGIWTEATTGRITVRERKKGNFLLSLAYGEKNRMMGIIDNILPLPSSAILKGIILGDQESLPPEILSDFRGTGTAHVLVVSGLHVGLVLLIIFLLFKTVGLPTKWATALSLPLLFYYALLTGLRAPVLRATLMASVGLVAYLLNRETPLLVILSLAALFILILRPTSLFTVSFQLSFIAVAGIVYLTPQLEKMLKMLPLWIGRSLAVSLAAQLSILPLLAYYFQQLPLIGLVANLAIVPTMTIILALGFLTLGLAPISFSVAQIVANTNWLVLSSLGKLVHFLSFSSFPVVSSLVCPQVSSFSFWLLLVYYAVLIIFIYLLERLSRAISSSQ